ncbi:MAG TPA: hypothetical protein VKN18_25090 [Blastocatellia bacterium]|nr:hypothetical protein [Blastocatellia bacterium]
MRNLILTVVTILSIGATSVASAHRQETVKSEAVKSETFTLRAGKQKRVARGELTIKFVNVIEDSRCPVGVNCIQAGNAKIQVKVTDRRGQTKTMELNTNKEPKGDQLGPYAINLVNLEPQPMKEGKPARSRYTARFSIQRLRS